MSSKFQDRDPEPGVLALRRESALKEASRLVALAESRLAALQLTGVDFRPLRNSIAALEKSVTGSGSREVQGRKRYRAKRSHGRRGSPQAEHFLFIDESGSWQLPSDSAGDDWFALGAVAMTKDAVARYAAAADEIKMVFFRDPSITFHEPQMRRGETRFDFRGDEAKREQFANAVDLLVSEAEFTAFGVGIRKRELARSSTVLSMDSHLPAEPYALALHLLLERFVDYLAYRPDRPKASITMESQESHLDALHQQTVAETIAYGTQYVAPQGFQRFLNPGVEFVRKRGSHPTELADMLARDLFEWIRSDCLHDPVRWALFREKFYKRGDRRRGKFGLKVFPDSDIAQQIAKNRERVKN